MTFHPEFLLALIPPTIAALGAWWSAHRGVQKTQEIHLIVNSQREAMLMEIQSLRDQLKVLQAAVMYSPPPQP